jgi:hypothetical protein
LFTYAKFYSCLEPLLHSSESGLYGDQVMQLHYSSLHSLTDVVCTPSIARSSMLIAAYHGFRNRTSRKRAYGGGIADCSKTALLFSLNSVLAFVAHRKALVIPQRLGSQTTELRRLRVVAHLTRVWRRGLEATVSAGSPPSPCATSSARAAFA